jgi:hypothetical protein
LRLKILGAITLLTLLAATFAYGERQLLRVVNISFEFRVGGKVLPAGQYKFAQDDRGQFVTITSAGKSTVRAQIHVITRLAAGMHTTPKDAHLVFDKVGSVRHLAELWIPGEDGFMLHSMKEQHEHEIIDVSR